MIFRSKYSLILIMYPIMDYCTSWRFYKKVVDVFLLFLIYRQRRAHEKKVKKAKARKNKELAERLLNRMPSYKLDTLILERFHFLTQELC